MAHGAMRGKPPEARLFARVDKTETCWLWTGPVNSYGYGRLAINGHQVMAHRLSYEFFVGPIPEGLTLDHLCRVRRCVRPEHLEPVTNAENVLRGESFVAVNKTKTHCPKGHVYDEANTRVYRGRRHCRACDRERLARRRAR